MQRGMSHLWCKQGMSMGWDRKQSGAASGYFYLSVRTPAGVKKVYMGRGAAGHESAAAVEKRRRARLAAKATVQAERDSLTEPDRLANELRELTNLLSTAWLILTGHHCHRGCWRHRKRNG
jgi:hypothetical protein